MQLRLGEVLIRSFAIPLCGLSVVLFDAFSALIAAAEYELRLGEPLIRGLPVEGVQIHG